MSDTFPESTTRHGTPSGFTKHQVNSERPCDACIRAKSDYDARRLNSTELRDRNRAYASAAGLAKKRLVAAHKAEYDALYRQAKTEVLSRIEANS